MHKRWATISIDNQFASLSLLLLCKFVVCIGYRRFNFGVYLLRDVYTQPTDWIVLRLRESGEPESHFRSSRGGGRCEHEHVIRHTRTAYTGQRPIHENFEAIRLSIWPLSRADATVVTRFVCGDDQMQSWFFSHLKSFCAALYEIGIAASRWQQDTHGDAFFSASGHSLFMK